MRPAHADRENWYESQDQPWTCGAASLCMAYRRLGLECSQGEVWAALSGSSGRSRGPMPTHRLARDAWRRGLAALVVQARRPRRLLEQCQRLGVPAIVRHRLSAHKPRWHFSVLAGLDGEGVVLADPLPLAGPRLRRDWETFRELWNPHPDEPEVAGYCLVAVGLAHKPGALATGPHAVPALALGACVPALAPAACGACGVPFPPGLVCPNCAGVVGLEPAGVLGCLRTVCAERTWERVFCPHCDAGLTELVVPLPDPLRPAGKENESMADEQEIQQLAAALATYQSLLTQVQQQMPDPSVRGELVRMQQLILSNYARLVEECRQQQSAAQERRQKVQQDAAEVTKNAPPVPEPVAARKVPVKEIDPRLGEKLKNDLLGEFGTSGTPPWAT
jgi:hypothetical protein